RADFVEKVQQHLFMISSQANHLLRVFGAQVKNVLNTTRHVRPSIDQVTKKNQLVSRFARQQIEQIQKLRATAVNVANYKSLHTLLLIGAGVSSAWRGRTLKHSRFGLLFSWRRRLW